MGQLWPQKRKHREGESRRRVMSLNLFFFFFYSKRYQTGMVDHVSTATVRVGQVCEKLGISALSNLQSDIDEGQ